MIGLGGGGSATGLFLLALCGCTHTQLARSMVDTASTVMEIQYQIVLNNLAMMSQNPFLLPWHIRLKEGTVQVNDEVGLYDLRISVGGGSATAGGPRLLRGLTEQWGADAVGDPKDLAMLRNMYRRALGLGLLPLPRFLLRAKEDDGEVPEDETAVLALERDIPLGWYGRGRRGDVPGDAVYVGHYRDRWVWVRPEGIEGLSHFTLAILSILKFKQGQTTTSRGLIFSR